MLLGNYRFQSQSGNAVIDTAGKIGAAYFGIFHFWKIINNSYSKVHQHQLQLIQQIHQLGLELYLKILSKS